MNQQEEKMAREKCPGCGHEVDPEVCCCGNPMTDSYHDNHHPIPMGCTCGYLTQPEQETP